MDIDATYRRILPIHTNELRSSLFLNAPALSQWGPYCATFIFPLEDRQQSVTPQKEGFMKTILRLVLLVVFFDSCSALLAQGVGTGTISGIVTDANNAALPSASVRIINTDTGTERMVTTTDAGDYRADLLQPGHYEIV